MITGGTIAPALPAGRGDGFAYGTGLLRTRPPPGGAGGGKVAKRLQLQALPGPGGDLRPWPGARQAGAGGTLLGGELREEVPLVGLKPFFPR